MKKNSIPISVNLHHLNPCNYSCGFCHAGFASAKCSHVPQAELHEIIRQISSAPTAPGRGSRKVTFAGGEPLLSPTIFEDIAFAKHQGLFTALVTNGSLLTKEKINRVASDLDWLSISIDSLDAQTNRRIGRAARGIPVSAGDYLAKIQEAHRLGIRVKLNTVVNRANVGEDFSAFIRAAQPRRWKLFQAVQIAEENSQVFDKWAISEAAFRDFVARHESLSREGVVLVPETQEDIYGTYAMVAPNGCFFDNSLGTYRYSRPIVSVGIEAAWAEITFSPERFRARQGDYDFVTGLNREEAAR